MNKKSKNEYNHYIINTNNFSNEINTIEIIKNLKLIYKQKKYFPCTEYINVRPKAIKMLLQYNNIYHYSKKVFYLSILYLDIIFQSLRTSVLLNDKYEIYIINIIILAGKFYEDDIKSISFERFINYNNNKCNLNVDDIGLNEITCLKMLNYKLNYYSVFDILTLLIKDYLNITSIDNKDYYNKIYTFPFNILDNIILSNITINYSPIDIAFSLLYKTHMNFQLNNKYFNEFNKKYYFINSDYKECLNNINNILNIQNKIYFLDFNNEHKQIKNNREKNEENKKNVDINKIYDFILNITQKNK